MSKASEVRRIVENLRGGLFSQRYARDYILDLIPEDPDRLADEEWIRSLGKQNHGDVRDVFLLGKDKEYRDLWFMEVDDHPGEWAIFVDDLLVVRTPTRLQVALIEAAFAKEKRDG